MKARNFHLLAAEYKWAHAKTGDVVRALQHVFEIDLENGFRATLAEEARRRAAVRTERRKRLGIAAHVPRYRLGFELLGAVAERHGIPAERLRVRGHSVAHGFIRAEVVWHLRQCGQRYSYPDCAAIVGMEDHTSALAAFRKFDRALAENKELRARVLGAA